MKNTDGKKSLETVPLRQGGIWDASSNGICTCVVYVVVIAPAAPPDKGLGMYCTCVVYVVVIAPTAPLDKGLGMYCTCVVYVVVIAPAAPLDKGLGMYCTCVVMW
jgi:hypothetical protein